MEKLQTIVWKLLFGKYCWEKLKVVGKVVYPGCMHNHVRYCMYPGCMQKHVRILDLSHILLRFCVYLGCM